MLFNVPVGTHACDRGNARGTRLYLFCSGDRRAYVAGDSFRYTREPCGGIIHFLERCEDTYCSHSVCEHRAIVRRQQQIQRFPVQSSGMDMIHDIVACKLGNVQQDMTSEKCVTDLAGATKRLVEAS